MKPARYATIESDVTEQPRRHKSASQRRRDAVHILARRADFLTHRAEKLRSAGLSDHIETRDIAVIRYALDVLTGAPVAELPARERAAVREVLDNRRRMLDAEIPKMIAAGGDATRERREVKALEFTIDTLAANWAGVR